MSKYSNYSEWLEASMRREPDFKLSLLPDPPKRTEIQPDNSDQSTQPLSTVKPYSRTTIQPSESKQESGESKPENPNIIFHGSPLRVGDWLRVVGWPDDVLVSDKSLVGRVVQVRELSETRIVVRWPTQAVGIVAEADFYTPVFLLGCEPLDGSRR